MRKKLLVCCFTLTSIAAASFGHETATPTSAAATPTRTVTPMMATPTRTVTSPIVTPTHTVTPMMGTPTRTRTVTPMTHTGTPTGTPTAGTVTTTVTPMVTMTPAAGGAPTSVDQCKDGGWRTFRNPRFKNQGDCVSFVASQGRAGGNPKRSRTPAP